MAAGLAWGKLKPVAFVALMLVVSVGVSGLWRPMERRRLAMNVRSHYDLKAAVVWYDPRRVERLLKRGANPNGDADDRITPLYLACMMPRTNVPELLLEYGADVNLSKASKATPLHAAASQSRVEVISLLLRHGANLEARDSMGQTPLHQATISAQPERMAAVRVLVEAGADVNAEDNSGSRPLDHAERFKDGSADYLRKNGAKPGSPIYGPPGYWFKGNRPR